MCRLSWNLGASTSWNHQGLSRPVMGLLYPLHNKQHNKNTNLIWQAPSVEPCVMYTCWIIEMKYEDRHYNNTAKCDGTCSDLDGISSKYLLPCKKLTPGYSLTQILSLFPYFTRVVFISCLVFTRNQTPEFFCWQSVMNSISVNLTSCFVIRFNWPLQITVIKAELQIHPHVKIKEYHKKDQNKEGMS
jgi:hypothetical protein